MKVFFIILSMLFLMFTSCNSWLDVNPQDIVDEKDLFEAGDGYRNVLNGVYKQMASPALYGRELSWGTVDILGQLYHSRAFGTGTAYRSMASYKYEDKLVKPIIQEIWSKAFNSIANCNSILAVIDREDSTKFKGYNNEKLLIKGEALALRAFLHFDMLRLFAPNPADGDAKPYIPYFKVYPSVFEPDLSSKEVLELVIKDLELARTLVAPHDTIAWRKMLETQYRIKYTQTNPDVNQDLFFQNRGFRMNYLAVCSLLARVYNYYGVYDPAYFDKAYDMAEHVINFNLNKDKEDKLEFTPYYNVAENKKMYDEVVFCLSNQKLLEDYEELTSDSKYPFYLKSASELFDDNADVRHKDLTEAKGSYLICTKNILPAGQKGDYDYCQDMLPLIRLSELYYLQAECLCRKGDIAGAVEKIDAVRGKRNCQTGASGKMHQNIRDWDSFKSEMVKEVACDFMQEGQTFFYYKRFGLFPKQDMNLENMTFPKPDNELIN